MHACVKKGAKVCKCGFTYIGHMAEIHTLHFKYWFFDDPFSTRIGFLLTPSVLKMQKCNFVTKVSTMYQKIHSNPFFTVNKIEGTPILKLAMVKR